ncbi:hypothetical protein HJA83_00390 [Rhizobium bangladeshense]|uniref:hypothetical protein n=1 Tax=Rhizobium bangladeshense TaxID=1138189 RepID=UPI001C835A33|nr:hypothetical protein [Rhizobium bangladeshense]MBX4899822.1 hypothetical protein [Rhizobium bangladeshense]
MPFSLIDAPIELFNSTGGPTDSHRIQMDVRERSGASPLLSVAVDARDRLLELSGSWPQQPEQAELVVLSLADTNDLRDLLGLQLGAGAPKGINLEIRPGAADGSNPDSPFFALFSTWTLEATVGKTDAASAQPNPPGLEVGASAAVDVRIGFAARAQHSDLGIANFAVRIDLLSFGITSGWIPLALFDIGTWSPFEMPGLLSWFAGIVGLKIPDLPPIRWDVDFPLAITLPFGLSVRDSEFRIAPTDGTPRVHLLARGLILKLGSASLPYDDFRLDLEWNGSSYTLRIVVAEWKRAPDEGGFFFSLPFNLLTAKAAAWRFRLGFFAHDGKACLDTVLEVGGLTLEYGEKRSLLEAHLRMHLRDMRFLTAAPTGTHTLFEGEGPTYDPYKIPIPRLSFVQSPADSEANDYGIQLLDGAVDGGKCLYVAWRQRGNQFLKALAHDLFGSTPAGAIPGDAEELLAGLEIASLKAPNGRRDLQLRFDWRENAASPATLAATKLVTAPAGAMKDDLLCFTPEQLKTGIVLPVPAAQLPDVSTISAGADAMVLSLLGLTLRIARPTSQSIVYRSESDGGDSVAWLANYDVAPTFASGGAVAEATIDFSLVDPAGGARQVQPSSSSPGREPFLRALLGGLAGGSVAIATWREGDRPRFLQAYSGGTPVGSLIPSSAGTDLGEDSCPGMPAPYRGALPLPASAFQGFELGQQGAWQLALQTKLLESALKLFGDGRRVNVKINEVCVDAEATAVILATELTVELSSDTKVTGTVRFRFGIDDLALSVDGPARLTVDLPVEDTFPAWAADVLDATAISNSRISKPVEFLGFELRALRKGSDATPIGTFTLSFNDGRFVLGIPDGTDGTEDVDVILRHKGFGGAGLVFRVDRFALGSGGLDLDANLVPVPLKLPGLIKPFVLKAAHLSIVGGRMQDLVISGSGNLPELLNAAPVEIAVHLSQGAKGDIVLKDFECSLGDGDAPIFSRGVRCRFELTKLTIDRDDANGTKPIAWFFVISGALQFRPEGSEFKGNLLEDFDSIRCEFANAPLGDEFFEHIELIVALNQPRRFKVLNLFDMEVRGLGFHPRYPGFDRPAIIIAGQIAFGDVGDVLSVEVDFHRLYLGLPSAHDPLPPVDAKGLRVAISSSGFKIAGRVDYLDSDLIDGFAGEGTVLIPGLPELSAAFAFAKLRAFVSDRWKRGWFIAVEASKISYQIGPLPLYLRQIGLGFGYRFTSVMIKRFEDESDLGTLVKMMLAELAQHQTLARLSSWAPDPERDSGGQPRWSIGLEAVLSMTSANSTPTKYEPEAERKLKTLILQLLVFLRSDFTFLAAAKLWFPVSMDDFFEDVDAMRSRPLALGFVSYQPSKSRLLAHAAKGKNPYFGRSGDRPLPDQVIKILDDSHFEATFLSEPGVLHAELGWPDRLFFNFRIGPLKLECRGGILYRLDREMLVHGIFFSGRGKLTVGGSASLGIVGAEVSADIDVAAAMRLMVGLKLPRPTQSIIYAAAGLDVAVRFSIYVWFRLNLRFCKIEINLRFALDLQLVVALEIGWAGHADLGCRARATLVIGAFGRQLKVTVRASFGSENIDTAQRELAPYMAGFLEPGAIPAIPGLGTTSVAKHPVSIDAALKAAAPRGIMEIGSHANDELLDLAEGPEQIVVDAADAFVFARMRGQSTGNEKRLWFGWVIPSPTSEYFYPVSPPPKSDQRGEIAYADLTLPVNKDELVFVPRVDGETLRWMKAEPLSGASTQVLELRTRPESTISMNFTDGGPTEPLTFMQLLASCYTPPKDYPRDDFPFKWNEDGGPSTVGEAARLQTRKAANDDRILDPNNPARAPRRSLDPNNTYDSHLLKSGAAHASWAAGLGTSDAEDTQRVADRLEQAFGTQAWLMRSFTEDLDTIAAKTSMADGLPTPLALPGGRPSIADLGLFVCVEARVCPSWLGDFEAAKKAQIDFKLPHRGPQTVNFAGPIGPVVDFNKADFSINKPNLTRRAEYFDEETLNFAWDISWGADGTPASRLPEDPDITHFLAACEIVVTMDGDRIIDTGRVLPVDILVDNSTRLPPRYQYSRSIASLGLDQIDSLSLETRVTATIRPIAQDRSEGDEFSMTAVYRPRATPLAADDVNLVLHFRDDRALSGRLSWRELIPANDPGVLPVRRRELILRPLRRLPLGAYPEEAVDADDAGLVSAIGSGLRDGDIIVALSAKLQGIDPAHLPRLLPESETVTPPTQKAFSIDFDDAPSALVEGVFDHLGRRLDLNTPQARMAFGFLRREPATANGSAWNVFVRTSATALPPGNDLPTLGYSSPIRARIVLAQAEPDEAAPKMRVLNHLEWLPSQVHSAPRQLTELSATPGYLHAATLIDKDTIGYLPRPGNEIGVTVRWSARPSVDHAIETVASYQLYEAVMDAHVNFDRVAGSSFAVRWQKAHEVKPTDIPFAGRTVNSFVQPDIWDASTPPYAATLSFLHKKGVPPQEMVSKWPGWYSWNESELNWPPFLPPLKGPAADIAERGVFIAKRRLHPYLSLLVGCLADKGADKDIGDKSGATFTVEVSAGKAIKPEGDASGGRLPDPVTWMRQDVEEDDKLGWGGLNHLGLAVTIALRDPLTGVYLTQSQVRAEIQDARDRAEALVASDPLFAECDTYLAMDLPLQHERAVATEATLTPLNKSDPILLSMVQLTLRPKPIWLRRGDDWTGYRGVSYHVFSNPKGEALRTGTVNLGGDLHVVYLDGPVRQTKFPAGSTIEFEALLPPGCRRAVMCWNGYGSLERILDINPKFWRHDLEKEPAPLVAGAEDPMFTPFGRFSPEEGLLGTALVCTTAGTSGAKEMRIADRYERFLEYLAQAFSPVDLERLKNDAALPIAYIRWASRFFRSASVGDQIATLVAPNRATPSRMAPDSRGTLSVTHMIRDDLAGLRSYAVRIIDRYHVLQTGAEPAEPIGFSPSERVDVEIRRRRKLLPPKVIALRLLTAPDAVQYHELTTSEHVEQTLSRNLLVRRKLEFDDVKRRHKLEFAFADWLDSLQQDGVVTEAKWPPDLVGPGGRTAAPPRGLGADTFLSAAPLARFGARRVVTFAEAFYYKQTATAVAFARSVQSLPLEVTLPPPNATPPIPSGANPTVFTPTVDWSAFEMLQTRHQMLASSLGGHPVVPYLLPLRGVHIETRFPRLFEHLVPAALKGHLAGESFRGTYGCLPNPLGRLEIVAETGGTRASVGVLESRRVPVQSERLFAYRNVSNDLTAVLVAYPQPSEDWHEGLWFSFDVVEAKPLAISDGLADLVTMAVERTQFNSHRVASLAALAVRLNVDGVSGSKTVTEVAPIDGPVWLYRPSLEIKDDGPAKPRDREIGLRLLLDRHRFAAAEQAGDDRTLLADIEEAGQVILSQSFPSSADVSSINAALNGIKHSLWLRVDNTWNAIDAIPAQVEAGQQLLISGDLNDGVYTAVSAASLPVYDPPPSLNEARDVAALASALAELYVKRSAAVSVVAHHGNLPPAKWGETYAF